MGDIARPQRLEYGIWVMPQAMGADYPWPTMIDGGHSTDEAATSTLREHAWRQVDAAVIITDTNGLIVDWNAGATGLFGWTAKEAIGASWNDLAGPVAADPDPRRAQIQDHLSGGGTYTGELTVGIKDGRRIPILVSHGLVRDDAGLVIGSIFIAIDDSRRSHAEERFEVAFRESPVASAITSGKRQLILDVNPAFEALSGIERRDVIGRTSNELGLWEDPEISAAVLELTTREQSLTDRPIRFRTALGRIVQARLSGRPITLSDGPAYLWMAVDETDRVRAEEGLHRAQHLESIGLLAGGIAHDFNNVMTAIGGSAELALRQLGPDHPVADDLEEIVGTAARAVGLTRQLLAFSGRQVLRHETIDLAEIVREMAPMLRRLTRSGIDLVVRSSGGPALVSGDPGQLRQVLLNLAVNAVDALPGGGTLRIETTSVDGGGAGDAGLVRLLVSDTGTGMDDAVKGRIFEPFFTTKPAGQGTGLGLAVAHGIIEQSGGTITVDSRLGDGTTFRIELPRVGGAAPADAPAPVDLLDDERSATILLVEDEAAIRALARRVLERRGHHVVEAEDGIAGLEALATIESLDLVLTDLTMPRMGGQEMAHRIGELYPDVPIVFMSGYGESRLAEDGVLDPSIRLLSKPFAIDDLAAIIQRTLAETR